MRAHVLVHTSNPISSVTHQSHPIIYEGLCYKPFIKPHQTEIIAINCVKVSCLGRNTYSLLRRVYSQFFCTSNKILLIKNHNQAD